MLFYVTLLLTSFLLTLVILGVRTLIVSVFRRLSSKGKAIVSPASSSRGRRNHAAPVVMAKAHPAAPYSASPWGWHESGKSRPSTATAGGGTLSGYLSRRYERQKPPADWKREIGRPIRDDFSPLSGKVYKPSEEAISRYGMDKKD